MSKTLKHIGIIVDGNRRWARQQGLNPSQGHKVGYQTLRKIALYAADKNIRYLSAFVFSTENWQRTKNEVSYLMNLILEVFKKHILEFKEAGIRIVILGSRQGLSKKVLKTLDSTEAETKDNNKVTIAICLNYGGQLEIVEAVRKITLQDLQPEDITEKTISKNLYHPEIPPVDIIVRTSGEQRISNFMLWRAAYSELMFFDKFWPDFTVDDFDEVIKEYNRRQRRFGA